jgi:hypothetical protein
MADRLGAGAASLSLCLVSWLEERSRRENIVIVSALANADNVNDFLDCGGPDAALDPYLWPAGPKPRSWKFLLEPFLRMPGAALPRL